MSEAARDTALAAGHLEMAVLSFSPGPRGQGRARQVQASRPCGPSRPTLRLWLLGVDTGPCPQEQEGVPYGQTLWVHKGGLERRAAQVTQGSGREDVC